MAESQIKVAYPLEIDDEMLSCGHTVPSRLRTSWMRGWNYVTTLYRVIEHVLNGQRSQQNAVVVPGSELLFLFARPSAAQATVLLDLLDHIYQPLPPEFKDIRPWTGNVALDRYSFQATNILATTITCRAAILSSDHNALTAHFASIESAMIRLTSIPSEYLQAISTPFCHHVAGIGYTLAKSVGPSTVFFYLLCARCE